MKKNYVTWILAVTTIIFLFATIFFGYTDLLKSGELINQNINLTNKSDSLQKAYNDCAGLTPVVSVAPVVTAVAAPAPAPQKTVSPVVKAKLSAGKKVKTKTDVKETIFPQSSFIITSTKSSTPVRTIEVTTSENGTSVPNTTYQGAKIGDIGTTTNYDRYLIYYMKNVGLTGTEWYVNGDPNKKMILDKSGYWYYIDTNRKLSDTEITSAIITWNVKGPKVDWGGGSYQAWWPHESLKPLIKAVRGFEYGFITDEDLNNMSIKDSRVWSPNNPNGVYQPLQGITGKERTDQNFWHGWNFRTKISYKKTTMN